MTGSRLGLFCVNLCKFITELLTLTCVISGRLFDHGQGLLCLTDTFLVLISQLKHVVGTKSEPSQ